MFNKCAYTEIVFGLVISISQAIPGSHQLPYDLQCSSACTHAHMCVYLKFQDIFAAAEGRNMALQLEDSRQALFNVVSKRRCPMSA